MKDPGDCQMARMGRVAPHTSGVWPFGLGSPTWYTVHVNSAQEVGPPAEQGTVGKFL